MTLIARAARVARATTITGIAFGSIAIAQSQTVIPDTGWTVSGQLSITTSSTIGTTCDVNGWGESNASSNAGTLEAFTPGGSFICSNLVTDRLPVETSSADTSVTPVTVTAHDTSVDTSLGNCSDDVTGEWNSDASATGASRQWRSHFQQFAVG